MIILTAVGDIFPGNLPYHVSNGIASSFFRHQGKPWATSMKACFEGSDIGLANLESPLLGEDDKPHQIEFAGSTEFAAFLSQMGINVVSVANNHILEQGADGFALTLKTLPQNGIQVIGTYTETGSNILKIEKNGLSIALAAFNDIRDIANPNLHGDFSEHNVLESIKAMAGADFKVLVFHWGNEYVHVPSYDQITLAKRFIDAGADIIIGHHPHVVQPAMHYKHGIILFSLGNYLFDLTYRENVRIGMTARFELIKGHIPKYTLQGIRIRDDYTPTVLSEKTFARILGKHEALFEKYLHMTEDDYRREYLAMWKRNRLLQRIWMKKDLLNKLPKMSKREHNLLLQRVLSLFSFRGRII